MSTVTQAQVLRVLQDLIAEEGAIALEVSDWILRAVHQVKLVSPWQQDKTGAGDQIPRWTRAPWGPHRKVGDMVALVVPDRSQEVWALDIVRWRWKVYAPSPVDKELGEGCSDTVAEAQAAADAVLRANGWQESQHEKEPQYYSR